MRVTFFSARCFRSSSQGMLVPFESAVVPRSSTACAIPFTKQRTTSFPDASVALLNVAISL